VTDEWVWDLHECRLPQGKLGLNWTCPDCGVPWRCVARPVEEHMHLFWWPLGVGSTHYLSPPI